MRRIGELKKSARLKHGCDDTSNSVENPREGESPPTRATTDPAAGWPPYESDAQEDCLSTGALNYIRGASRKRDALYIYHCA